MGVGPACRRRLIVQKTTGRAWKVLVHRGMQGNGGMVPLDGQRWLDVG
jgi:hypothetical protein